MTFLLRSGSWLRELPIKPFWTGLITAAFSQYPGCVTQFCAMGRLKASSVKKTPISHLPNIDQDGDNNNNNNNNNNNYNNDNNSNNYDSKCTVDVESLCSLLLSVIPETVRAISSLVSYSRFSKL